MANPSKPWRLVIATPSGPSYENYRSEAATREGVEVAKSTTPGSTIVVQKWNNTTARWEEWLRWVRSDGEWTTE